MFEKSSKDKQFSFFSELIIPAKAKGMFSAGLLSP